METEIKNFSEIANLIRSNPKRADNKAREWDMFTKKHPETNEFLTLNGFLRWGMDARIDPQRLRELWLGKEITSIYFHLMDEQEKPREQRQETITPGNVPAGPVATPFLFLAYKNRAKLMEGDEDYKKIVERKKEEWTQKNPDKDFKSKEWLDYNYGSLDDSNKPSLKKEAEEEFRKEAKEEALLGKRRKENRIRDYDREKKGVYSNIGNDRAVTKTQSDIQEEANARYESLRHSENASYEDILKRVKKKKWEEFVEKHTEKTSVYKIIHPEIAAANDRQEVKKELLKHRETTGSIVKPVEKIPKETPATTQSEADKRLKNAFSPAPSPPGLVFPVGWGKTKPKPKVVEQGELSQQTKIPPPFPQKPKTQPAPVRPPSLGFQWSLKNPQVPHVSQGGRPPVFVTSGNSGPSAFTRAFNRGMGGGINKINMFSANRSSFTKPFSFLTNKVGGKIASYAIRLVATNPEVLVPILVIVLILIFTFNIVGFAGGTESGGSPPPTPPPSGATTAPYPATSIVPPPNMDMWVGNTVFYCQGDPRWDNRTSCGIGENGCGPTSVAIIMSSFGDTRTPAQIHRLFLQNNWVDCAYGLINPASVMNWLTTQGFTYQPISPDEIKQFVDAGYLILASSPNYPCANCKTGITSVSHIFVIDGVDRGKNLVHVQDPNDCSYTTGDEFRSGRIVSLGAFSWRYGYAIKK